jgi:hypothetical protein
VAMSAQQLEREAKALLAQAGQSKIGDDGEGITLLPSGKVRAVVNGKRHDLRRPKVGEFSDLNQKLYEIDDEEKVRIADAQTRQEGNGRPLRIDSTDLLLGWVRLAFETLGSPLFERTEDEDLVAQQNRELPEWMAAPTLPIELMRHWRELPLARSAPSQ